MQDVIARLDFPCFDGAVFRPNGHSRVLDMNQGRSRHPSGIIDQDQNNRMVRMFDAPTIPVEPGWWRLAVATWSL